MKIWSTEGKIKKKKKDFFFLFVSIELFMYVLWELIWNMRKIWDRDPCRGENSRRKKMYIYIICEKEVEIYRAITGSMLFYFYLPSLHLFFSSELYIHSLPHTSLLFRNDRIIQFGHRINSNLYMFYMI